MLFIRHIIFANGTEGLVGAWVNLSGSAGVSQNGGRIANLVAILVAVIVNRAGAAAASLECVVEVKGMSHFMGDKVRDMGK